jgi:hypothetical protein
MPVAWDRAPVLIRTAKQNPKSEALNTKQFSKFKSTNNQNNFEHLNFGNWNLFRISNLDIRICRPAGLTPSR